jgi:hypothetical protein
MSYTAIKEFIQSKIEAGKYLLNVKSYLFGRTNGQLQGYEYLSLKSPFESSAIGKVVLRRQIRRCILEHPFDLVYHTFLTGQEVRKSEI